MWSNDKNRKTLNEISLPLFVFFPFFLYLFEPTTIIP